MPREEVYAFVKWGFAILVVDIIGRTESASVSNHARWTTPHRVTVRPNFNNTLYQLRPFRLYPCWHLYLIFELRDERITAEYRKIVVAGMRKLTWALSINATDAQLVQILLGAGFSTYSHSPLSAYVSIFHSHFTKFSTPNMWVVV